MATPIVQLSTIRADVSYTSTMGGDSALAAASPSNLSYFREGDMFYEKYKEEKYPLALIGVILIFDLISLFGAIGNITIFYATYRSQSLRSSCNYLLAIVALADLSYEVTHATPMAVLLSGTTFIRLQQCFYLSVVPLFGLNVSVIMMFFIAADRLAAVFYPIWHRKRSVPAYIAVLSVAATTYALVMLSFPYTHARRNANQAVVCILHECFPGEVGDIYFKSMALFNLLTVLCYAAIRWRLRRNDGSNVSTRRMFKSLAIIVTIICVGWLASALWFLASQMLFHFDEVQLWFVRSSVGIPINIAATLSAPVLYLCSKDYNTAIFNVYLKLFQHFGLCTSEISLAESTKSPSTQNHKSPNNTTKQHLPVGEKEGARRRKTAEVIIPMRKPIGGGGGGGKGVMENMDQGEGGAAGGMGKAISNERREVGEPVGPPPLARSNPAVAFVATRKRNSIHPAH